MGVVEESATENGVSKKSPSNEKTERTELPVESSEDRKVLTPPSPVAENNTTVAHSPKLESQRLKEAREKLRRSHDNLDVRERVHDRKSRDGSQGRDSSNRRDSRSPAGSHHSRYRREYRRRERSQSRSRSRTPSRYRRRSRTRSQSRGRSRSPSHRRGRGKSRSASRDRGRYSRRERSRSRSYTPSSRSRSRSISRSRSRSRSRSKSWQSHRDRDHSSRSSSRSRERKDYSRSLRRSRHRYYSRRRTPSRSRSRSRSLSYSRGRRYRTPSYSPHSSRHGRDRRSYPISDRNRSPKNRDSSRYSLYNESQPNWRRRRSEDDLEYRKPHANKRRRQLEPEVEGERDFRTVFVYRLSPKVRENDLYDFFLRAGKVRDVRLIMDRKSSRHKGAGYVEFYNQESVRKAVAMAGEALLGYPVAVKPSIDERMVLANSSMGFESNTAPSEYAGPSVGSQQPLASPIPPSGNNMPITAAVGWSMASRRPVRQVPAQNASSFGRIPANSASVQNSKLVSVKELAVMLNPNNLPAGPVSSSAAGHHETASLGGSASSKRVYIGSVPFHFGESDLKHIFAPFGSITSIQLQRDPASGRSRGYGFLEFSDHVAARNAISVNGRDIGGRPLRVAFTSQSPSTTQPLASRSIPTGEVAGELDEGRECGVLMNASQKALLRERLSRGEDFGANTLSPAGVPWRKPLGTANDANKSLLLSNMFDPATEPKGFEDELAEDVRDECAAKYGTVTHLFVDKLSRGLVYVRFSSVDAARKAMLSLNGRWFGGLRVSAAYVNDEVYRKRFPDAPQ